MGGARGGKAQKGGPGPGPVSGVARCGVEEPGRRWVQPVGWVPLPAEGRGASSPFSPLGKFGEGRGGGGGKRKENPLLSFPPRGYRVALKGGKKRRRGLRSGEGGGGFPSASGTEGAGVGGGGAAVGAPI